MVTHGYQPRKGPMGRPPGGKSANIPEPTSNVPAGLRATTVRFYGELKKGGTNTRPTQQRPPSPQPPPVNDIPGESMAGYAPTQEPTNPIPPSDRPTSKIGPVLDYGISVEQFNKAAEFLREASNHPPIPLMLPLVVRGRCDECHTYLVRRRPLDSALSGFELLCFDCEEFLLGGARSAGSDGSVAVPGAVVLPSKWKRFWRRWFAPGV